MKKEEWKGDIGKKIFKNFISFQKFDKRYMHLTAPESSEVDSVYDECMKIIKGERNEQ